MKIELLIPENTISLENSRDLGNMSLEDIVYWCFSVEIRIEGYSNLYILLPEICLFQVIECFSQATQEILLSGKTKIWTDDRYNPNTLFIESINKLVTIKYSNYKIEITTDDFLVGATNFVSSSIAQAKKLFPKLNLNTDFNTAVENWLNMGEVT